jgi:hypothetical protein
VFPRREILYDRGMPLMILVVPYHGYPSLNPVNLGRRSSPGLPVLQPSIRVQHQAQDEGDRLLLHQRGLRAA